MKSFLVALFVSVIMAAPLVTRAADADSWTPIERQVAEITAGPQVTIVHFWAPWCSNCQTELAKNGWRDFLAVNGDVKVIFVTIWNPEEGRAELEKHGVGGQENFQLLLHPNGARTKDERVNRFLGLPIDWIPTTWIFKEGQLRFALNYGEVRFPLLQQLVRDAGDKWDRPTTGTKTIP